MIDIQQKISWCFQLFILFFLTQSAQAQLQPLTLQESELHLPVRDVYISNVKKNLAPMLAAKRAQLTGKNNLCLQKLKLVKSEHVFEWRVINSLQCALAGFRSKEVPVSGLRQAVNAVLSHRALLTDAPYRSILRPRLAEALVLLLQNDIKKNRPLAWQWLDELLLIKDTLSMSQLADLYADAGDLAFTDQKLAAALGYYNKSLSLQDSSDVRKKYESASMGLGIKASPGVDLEAKSEGLVGEEKEMADLWSKHLASGDVTALVEVGVKLLDKFPGGIRSASVQDKLNEVLLQVSSANDSKYFMLKDKVYRALLDVDNSGQCSFAHTLYNRGYASDSLRFFSNCVKATRRWQDAATSLFLAGQAAIQIENWDVARGYFERVIQQYSGSKESMESLYRLGLVDIRRGDFPNAQAWFERLLSRVGSENFELSARFWLWFTLKRLDNPSQAKEAEKILTRYPFTYYGFRVRAELNNQQIEFPKIKRGQLKEEIWLTARQKRIWSRYQVLVAGGWYEEAQFEIEALPPVATENQRMLMAMVHARTLDYLRGFQYLQSQTEGDVTDLVISKMLAVAYPKEFKNLVQESIKGKNVEANLLFSLIRQESAFQPWATSRAQAMGLTQVLPDTGKEVMVELKIKPTYWPDELYWPERNLAVGAQYLNKMLGLWSGQVPTALASYNAGPTRFSRWLDSRPGIKEKVLEQKGEILDDLWIEEMPWKETTFYVKAILRNLIIYRVLEKGTWQWQNPVWKNSDSEKSKLEQ